jgi:hypothetical protein
MFIHKNTQEFEWSEICMDFICWWYFLDAFYFILRDHEFSFTEVHPFIQRHRFVLKPFSKIWQPEKIGQSLVQGQTLGQKRNTFQAFGQPVNISILGSAVDLTSWQCSTGNVELGQLENVEMTIFLCANWWNGCELWSFGKMDLAKMWRQVGNLAEQLVFQNPTTKQ